VKLALHYAVRSNKGLVRGNNEDSAYAGPRLLAIADGMGGHAGGEVASKIVIGAVEELDEDRPGGDVITSLREAVEDANDSLAEAVRNDKKLTGMGTTLTALRFAGSTFGVVHVGDSRAYLLRGSQLTQITHDDTYVQSLVDAGRLTLDEASQHPRKSVILRALNGAAVDPDVSIREARLGDRYLLCTDGLTDVVRAETLREALSEGDPQDCADRLVALALRGGGPDNVTCIVADVVAEGQGDDVPVVAGAVVDPSEDGGDDDSPAARAAGLSGRGIPVARPRRPERRWTRVIVPIAIVVFLAAAATGTWFWTQTQYFVGQSGSIVAVFRGVDTKLGPMRFYRVVDRTAVKVADLRPAARDQVDSGITADSRADADAVIARLKANQLLPVCTVATATPTTPTSTAPATTTAHTTGHTTGHKKVTPTKTKAKTAKKVVKTTAPKKTASKGKAPAKSGRASGKAKAPVRKATTAKPKPTPTLIPPTPSPTPAASQVPGTDCRPVR
jgi:serine/threonine protein phosphatase PrpC